MRQPKLTHEKCESGCRETKNNDNKFLYHQLNGFNIFSKFNIGGKRGQYTLGYYKGKIFIIFLFRINNLTHIFFFINCFSVLIQGKKTGTYQLR